MLNRRNKAAMCATAICVGLILLLSDVGFRAILGITLLGMAFSWALGSNNRFVHWLFVVLGFLLLLDPAGVWYHWPRIKPELINTQASIVQADRDLMRSYFSLIAQETDRQEHRKDEVQQSKAFNELSKDEQDLKDLQTESRIRYVLKQDWGETAGGLLLLIAGLGLIVGISRARQKFTADLS